MLQLLKDFLQLFYGCGQLPKPHKYFAVIMVLVLLSFIPLAVIFQNHQNALVWIPLGALLTMFTIAIIEYLFADKEWWVGKRETNNKTRRDEE